MGIHAVSSRAPRKQFSWTRLVPVASENGQALIFSDKPEKRLI